MSNNRFRNRDILDNYLSRSKQNKEENQEVQNIYVYVIVRNIPKELHSKDLRKYFKGFVENGKFQCFHYRHRPELQGDKTGGTATSKNTCCCLVAFKTSEDREEFSKEFHKRNWQNSDGMEVPRRCFIDRILVRRNDEAGSSSSISENDLKEMIELKPPAAMPQGNIGTPSEYFLNQIRLCKMPASLIPKLGIQTGRRKRKFGEVPHEYEGDEEEFSDYGNSAPDDSTRREQFAASQNERTQSIQEEATPDEPTEKVRKAQNPKDNDDGPDDDDDQCEEWERHEALHDDVTEQDRTKPKKYEEEMEVTWEKGGPGLVWYTDKNYWDEKEKGTDCDLAWADDWDVDYSVYYEGKSVGDLDAKASLEIKQDELLRAGKVDQTVFTRKLPNGQQKRKRRHSVSEDVSEKASKQVHNGIGGMMLSRMGWKPGTGLGRNEQGKIVPVAVHLEEDGQSGRERKGFGYRGEKLSRIVEKKPVRHIIASVFDEVNDKGQNNDKSTGDLTTDEVLLRRDELTKMKYR